MDFQKCDFTLGPKLNQRLLITIIKKYSSKKILIFDCESQDHSFYLLHFFLRNYFEYIYKLKLIQKYKLRTIYRIEYTLASSYQQNHKFMDSQQLSLCSHMNTVNCSKLCFVYLTKDGTLVTFSYQFLDMELHVRVPYFTTVRLTPTQIEIRNSKQVNKLRTQSQSKCCSFPFTAAILNRQRSPPLVTCAEQIAIVNIDTITTPDAIIFYSQKNQNSVADSNSSAKNQWDCF